MNWGCPGVAPPLLDAGTTCSFGPPADLEHHYPSAPGAKDELGVPWGGPPSAGCGYHMQGSALDPGPHRPSSIDAQIDSLTRRCARCGENVVGDGTGCVAMDQVFHVPCFTCTTCHARLRGQPFYAMERRAYCEACYVVHCFEDFHRKFAPRCSVCGNAIMPEPGQEETVRIVALDRSFHIGCYKCEECGLLLSSEGEGRGCYPLDGHILCKSCSARRIQELSSKITTDC
ncbi:Thyroid receptor-interacting protein 6 [Chelonia mydas]|uniref:Thyroid receptor-interacting protein 6 n=1 Tax=Chelonia mydas TaxID=8469 RepID=M7CKH5_CHEMY|nr:Thyroid receptor-interacting protein 6 [Chelonia mydas]